MKLRRFSHLLGSVALRCGIGAAVAVALVSATASAQGRRKNPTSKIYVSDVSGEAMIDTGDTLEDLSKHSVYTAQGTVIETKAPKADAERSKYYSTMVYSNGTGAFFDADTRVEVRRFVQEPFTPNRSDVELEPSISQTQAFVSRGTVGLCMSKLVAGSNMIYQTPQGSVNIRGRKVVIEAEGGATKISMLEGESTVRGGSLDMGGHTVHAGEQAIIRTMGAGQPNQVEIRRIPPDEAPRLDDKVAMACMARKTVYFEVRERQVTTDKNGEAKGETGTDGGNGAGDGEPTGGSVVPNGPVTAFDSSSGSGGNVVTIPEIVPVEIIPVDLPVEFTVSPARIITPGRGPGG